MSQNVKKNQKRQLVVYSIEKYEGSLDFPCEFCNSNSYSNAHLKRNGVLEYVVCKDCFIEVMN